MLNTGLVILNHSFKYKDLNTAIEVLWHSEPLREPLYKHTRNEMNFNKTTIIYTLLTYQVLIIYLSSKPNKDILRQHNQILVIIG